MFESYPVAEALTMLAIVATPAVAGVAYVLFRDATAPQRYAHLYSEGTSPSERFNALAETYGKAMLAAGDDTLRARLDNLDDPAVLAFLGAYTDAQTATSAWTRGDLGEGEALATVLSAEITWGVLAGEIVSDEPNPFEARRLDVLRRREKSAGIPPVTDTF